MVLGQFVLFQNSLDMSDDFHDELLKSYASDDIAKYEAEKLYSSFRNLRNLCIQKDIQSSLGRNVVLDYAVTIIDKIIQRYEEHLLPPLKQGLQFIYNLSVNNDENRSVLWGKSSYLKEWMKFQMDGGVVNYVCGTLYNIALNPTYLVEVLNDISLVNLIIDSAMKGLDFPLLFIEYIFRSKLESNVSCLFGCNHKYHLFLTTLLLEYFKDNDIDLLYIDFIKGRYDDIVSRLVRDTSQESDLQEMFILIKILLEFSIRDKTLNALQSSTFVIDRTKCLLEHVHVKGKSHGSKFAPTEDIFTERTDVENLKANLIRLIANLCWRNRKLQDRIRESDGLPIILDSCVRDGKNPFITETAIFAIRNLCELNVENQNVIRNLNSEVHDNIIEKMHNRSSLYIPS